ncbi:Outer membrane protein TolC [Bryocella elongata]|uniref:Outer membrane protein TolC n=1 Tax=Bryocella elongata TaxID=863522 RepID=A0A1H6BRZ3_9BACT|nr:TolC family protein [Bryocella elongata]SEG63453.1 Outer membrane protein TolC [Bryocella elongata]
MPQGKAVKQAVCLACYLMSAVPGTVFAQCASTAVTAKAALECAAQNVPSDSVAKLDPSKDYSLAELIDIAEHNNPETRAAWERAKQRAETLGIARSSYYPILVGIATFADQRFVSPFPEALLPRGYSMVETPVAQPQIALQYLLFDFGKRGGEVATARAEALAAGSQFIHANQEVAFAVSKSYYDLLTAEERSEAARAILKTAQTTQDAAEAKLQNGRATLPDVLNARAETAQANFDLASADGQEQIARVALAEELGAEPSPDIRIDATKNAPLPDMLDLPIKALVDRAIADRPDLQAQMLEVQAADQEIRVAKGAYRPSIVLSGDVAQTAIWPTADNSGLGSANEPTWTVSLGIQWRIFDGGARKNELAIAHSKRREAGDTFRDLRDRAQREVWTSYIAFQTAERQQQAAVALLHSANESYSSSLDAYQSGVKNLVDVVTAEKQLALARLSSVSARSQLLLQAVQLEFTTGNLLRNLPPATRSQKQDGLSQ